MAIKIRFDNENNIIDPTIVLMSRSAVKYGSLQYNGLKAKINFNSYSELSFNVDKALCSEDLWGKLVDFKLIWVKDWNACFEINVDINEDNGISKTITAKSLGESELAQVNLYNIEVNTEDDIERSDYVPTILYNEENHKASLIHRLLEKCPHYRIGHIDSSIAGAQRTFQFNNQSILDAFDTISKEIDCAFIINCSINADGDLVRTINIYDLEFSCVDCGHRWEHIVDTCPSCNGTNINTGYGEDTHIFISSKNLAQQINYTTSTGSVKNCFKLQAGDDLMTSAVINCNPNGGQYLWYISDEVKEDMSDELSQKIDEYEDLCEYYQNEYQVDISSDDVNNYNRIIQKYSIYSQEHEQISLPIVGYSDLVKNLYNVLDFDIYLSNELMPTPQMINTTAEEQVAKLTTQSLSPVSVTDLSNLSLATANNVVLGMARVIVDNRYKITIVSSTLSNNIWQGSFCVTNYSNDDDTSTSGNINITINDDYENFLKQKIDKALQKSMTTNEAIDIVGLFKLGISDFTNEIKKYSLSILKSFYDNCQTCLDVLIEQGIANGETWGDKNPNLYTELYIPYRNKLTAIESEIALRESEVKVVKDIEDYLYDIKGDIQASLNLQAFLGDTLWEQFSAYRREDTYQNDNYISDGLGNSEMFEKAKAFIAEAQKNIYKSANLQHSISSTLKNLLMLREFQTLKDYFEEGNWLRIETDGEINRLRLMSYEVDYENTNDLSVEFSDVSKLKDGISDIQSVLDNSKSIASSFNAVTRQAKNGNDSRKTIDKWINSGIALNNIKIIQDAENQNVIFDNNGILCREYLPMIDSYDERQLKIINKGLFLTDDNWQSAKVGIGEIEYNGEKSYGVNAQLLVGDIIIGNELHIKDSQGHDILTVIDGRISTEVSEVKSAAASGTFEYYDPSNLNWTEQNNVDYFGYGLSQDEAETDTGIKAAGNNNKYFLNKHNGNLYKSNGTKWVFQKTLSPRFNNYSTIAYTDNKASTAESNAITNATNQVSTAKATIASSTLKYDETGITVSYYGYGVPTEIAGATQGKIYLDQDTGYVYTKNSGSGWTKSTSALTLITTKVATDAANDATTKANNAISTAATDATAKANTAENNAKTAAANAMSKYDEGSLTINYYGFGAPTTVAGSSQGEIYLDQNTGYYYTKGSGSTWTKSANALPLYADQKATEAYNNALGYVATYYITSEDSDTKINQTKQEIEMKAAKAVNKYEVPVGINVNFAGYGTPAVQGVKATAANQYYLDQETGNLYKSDSNKNWGSTPTHSLPIITDKLDTKITQTANDITLSVSQNYSTKTETSNAFDNAKTYAEGQATQAKNDAIADTVNKLKNYSTTTQMNTAITESAESIRLAASKAVSKYDITDKTVNFYAYGLSDDLTTTDTGIKATGNSGKFVLNQTDGKLYKSNGSKWVYQEALTTVTDKLDTKIDITAQGITQTVSQNYSTKTETSDAIGDAKDYAEDKATEAENNAKSYADDLSDEMTTTINQTADAIEMKAAKAVSKYQIPNGMTIHFAGYGTPIAQGAVATEANQNYLDQETGRVYTSKANKSWDMNSYQSLKLITDKLDTKIDITAQGITQTVSQNYSTKTETSDAIGDAKDYAEDKATEAENNAKSYADDLSDEMTTTINQTADAIEMKAAKAVSKYQIPNGMTIHFAGYGTPIAQGAVATEANQNYLDQETGRVYTSKANKSWDMNSYQSLKLITDNLDTKIDITAQGITQTVSQTYSTKSETSDKAAEAEANAKSTTAAGAGKYVIPTGLTITYYGYGLTDNDTKTDTGISATASDVSGKYFLNLTDGNVYQSNGIKWNKDTTVSPLKLASKQAEDNAKDYTDEQIVETTTSMNTKIDQTAEHIISSANARLEATVGYSSKNVLEITNNSTTTSGITYTVDKSAGTVTVNGTATKESQFSVPISPELSGDFYFSGCPAGGSSSKYDLYAWDKTTGARVKKWNGTTNSSSDYGETSQEIKLIQGHASQLTIRVQNGITVNNLVFRLMIRDGSFMDNSTFEPYRSVQTQITETNSKIDQTAESITSEVNKKVNITDLQANYSTTAQMNSAITSKANEISLKVCQSNTTYSKNKICPSRYTGKPSSSSNVTLTDSTGTIKFTTTGIWQSYSYNGKSLGLIMGHTYVVTCTNNTANSVGRIAYRNSSNVIKASVMLSSTGNKSFEFTFDDADGYISILATNNTTTSGSVNISSLMIRDKDVSDATFVAYVDSSSYLCSQISLSPDQIVLNSGRLIITSGNFKLDSSGTATMANASLTGGVIQTTNYSAASGNTKTVGGKINLAATGDALLFDTANFKITSGGSITAEGVSLNSCNINGGTIQILSSSEATRDNFMRLQSSYKGTDNKYYNFFMNVSPYQITHQYTKYSGATSSTAIDTRDIIYLGNNGNITILNTYLNGQSSSKQTSIGAGTVTTEDLFIQKLHTSRTDARIICYDSLHFANGTGIMLDDQRMAFQLYNNEVAVGVSTLPIRIYATAAYTPSAWVVSSDARQKQDIEMLDNRYLDIVKTIEPKRFKYINRPFDHYHTGYIAQDVKEAMDNTGVKLDELSAFVDVKGDGSDLALRYEEFIPLLHKWLQELEGRLSALEKKGE